jgi:hypothetical protein
VDNAANIIGGKMPLVSMVKEDRDLSTSYRKEKLPPSSKEMQRHGLKITSCTTTEEG